MLIRTFQLKVLLAIFVMLSLVGCGNYGYKVKHGKVIYSFWDGSKEVKYTLSDADAKSFEILLQNHFGADNRTVYQREKPISGADAKTFKLINRWHAVDKHYAYHDGQLIPNSISASFESLSSSFSKDDKDVYIATSAINACHSRTYKLLTNFWAKDKECAYAGFNRIKDADIDTFEGLNRFYAKDKNWVYASLYRKIEGDRISTLSEAKKKRLDEGRTGNLSLVYLVKGADANTFEVYSDSPIYGKDINQCYKYEKPYACSDIEL